jgi:citrate synthase
MVTPEIKKMADIVQQADVIDNEEFVKRDVKRGLRDLNGRGVLAGLTNISDIKAVKVVDGKTVPDYGRLYYRGYLIDDIVHGLVKSNRYGFEETAYLLIMGHLPTQKELDEFSDQLIKFRRLPYGFVRDIIMKAPSNDMMNTLARSVLTLYAYDSNADDTSIPNVLRQCLELISVFPMLSIYGYQAYKYYYESEGLFINNPLDHGSMAENILAMLRRDGKYMEVETRALDMALILHMDHGGGNNSTFTTHVVTSSLTDTYSVIAAALGSLKGPRHGGANIKVVRMFDEIMENVNDWKDEDEVSAYLEKILHGEAFDHSGLIYGVGHAVYSKSDPRAVLFKEFVKKVADAKGMQDEFELYALVERLAPALIEKEFKMYKGVSVNVDFYSGFAYRMMGLPEELYTPIFAMARIVGWSAHRLEELVNKGKIIRPAYTTVVEPRDYVPIEDREKPEQN